MTFRKKVTSSQRRVEREHELCVSSSSYITRYSPYELVYSASTRHLRRLTSRHKKHCLLRCCLDLLDGVHEAFIHVWRVHAVRLVFLVLWHFFAFRCPFCPARADGFYGALVTDHAPFAGGGHINACMHACMHGRWLFWGYVRLCRFDVGRWRWVALKFGTSYLCLCSEGGFLWFQGGVLGWKGERAD